MGTHRDDKWRGVLQGRSFSRKMVSENDNMQKQRYSIEDISKIITPIAQKFGIGKLSVFGSYARGEATPDSDLDFHLIDCGSLRGLFRLMGFESELEDRFQVPVDVIVGDSTFDDVYRNIQKEEIIIYDAH
jgi:predicted nucleotidyltransferase